MRCCMAGSWQIRSACRGISSFLAGGAAPQPMGHSLFVSPGTHLTPWSPNQKKNYFKGGKAACLWPGEGVELAHQVICSVLTLSKGEFRSLEEKNRKAAREEGQPTSAQQVLVMVQLPWKEAIGWVASPDWDKHTSSHWLSLQDMLFELGMKFCSSQFAWVLLCRLQTMGKASSGGIFTTGVLLHPCCGTSIIWRWFRASAAAKGKCQRGSACLQLPAEGAMIGTCHTWVINNTPAPSFPDS